MANVVSAKRSLCLIAADIFVLAFVHRAHWIRREFGLLLIERNVRWISVRRFHREVRLPRQIELGLPEEPNRWAREGSVLAALVEPDAWLVDACEHVQDAAGLVAPALLESFSVTLVSSARSTFDVQRDDALDRLQERCPSDLSALRQPSACMSTVVHDVPTLILNLHDGKWLRCVCDRSQAHMLTNC